MLNPKSQIQNPKSKTPKGKIIFLVGPTASGKTEAALHLAKKIGAEIISCDSMQIYRKLDILTSKPKKSACKNIPYHLIDIIDPEKEYNVSDYRKEALKKIKTIIKKDKIPLFVGGTGLYMSALIDGIFEGPMQNEKIRKKLFKQVEQMGSQYLFKQLQKKDPQAAVKIHPHDTKRIIRALEVFALSGRPISALQKERKGLADEYEIKIFCLNLPREKLYRRIEERLEKMFSLGLLEEVKRLLKLKLSRTAAFAIGIRELAGYFDGLYDLEQAKDLIKRNTRRYAKRQLTWFRKDKRITWINLIGNETPKEIAYKIN